MDKNEILRKVPDTVLQSGIAFDVDIIPESKKHKKRQLSGEAPLKRSFHMRRLTLGHIEKISGLLLQMNVDKLTPDVLVNLMADHTRTVATIVAMTTISSRENPDKELVDFFMHNLEVEELEGLVTLVANQMNSLSFMKSILSLKSLNLLTERSPKKEEIIASSTPGSSSAA